MTGNPLGLAALAGALMMTEDMMGARQTGAQPIDRLLPIPPMFPPPMPKRIRLGSGRRGVVNAPPANPLKKAKRKAQKRARAITRKSR